MIAFGGLLLLGGRLADHFGARRIFTLGFVVLTGASLVAGLANSDDVLVVGRALQGVGAALIAPSAMALVLGLFTDPRELGKAMGIWGASAPAGGTAGVFLGGVITEWVSWRWTFLINVPVALIVLALIPGLIPAGLAKARSYRPARRWRDHRRPLAHRLHHRDRERRRLGLGTERSCCLLPRQLSSRRSS